MTSSNLFWKDFETCRIFFVAFDVHFCSYPGRGTTASVALLSPDGQHAVLCNIGDSRVALVGSWTVLDHKGHAPQQLPNMVLSHAHRVTDPQEMARIDAAGEGMFVGGIRVSCFGKV